MNFASGAVGRRSRAAFIKPWMSVLVVASGLLFEGVPVLAAVVEATPVYITADNNGRYDRNPTLCLFEGEIWLFYTKGDDGGTGGVRNSNYNPDNDSYVIWYKRAPATENFMDAPETRLDLSETNRPEGFDQRDVSAVIFQGDLYVFASAGFGGSQQPVYYYRWDGSSWTGPTALGTGGGGHVNAVSDADRVYFTLETGVGETLQSVAYTWDGITLNGPHNIAAGNGVPKVTLKDGVLYVVSIAPSTTTINLHSCPASAAPSTWTYLSDPITVSGASVWDPAIYYDGEALGVMAAPSTAVPDQQWLVATRSTDDGLTWTPLRRVSSGGNGTDTWWDYWPCPFSGGDGDVFLLFVTEAKEGIYGDGMIAGVGVDWNLNNEHSFYIQPAIDMANPSDTVAVGGSTVWRGRGNRDLELYGKSLVVQGKLDSFDTTVIDCQGSASEPHRAFYLHDGAYQMMIIEKFSIINSYAGSESDGAILCTGLETNPIISNCRITHGSGAGIRVLENATVSVEGCTISHMDGDGVSVGTLYTSPAHFIGVGGSVLAHNSGAGIRVESCDATYITSTTMAHNAVGCYAIVGEPGAKKGPTDWQFNLYTSIAAFNQGDGIELTNYSGDVYTFDCNDAYGNGGDNFPPGYGPPDDPHRNFSADPFFCDTARDDYHMAANSPCLSEYNDCQVLVGALWDRCAAHFICGDANGDGGVNVGDAVYLVNYIFNEGSAPEPYEAGDVNCDTSVNVGDAVYLINFIFLEESPEPCADCP